MAFTNLIFISGFLPVVLILYTVLKKPMLQNILLVVFSLLFYSWLNPVSLVLMILCILWNYFTGYQIGLSEDEKEKKNTLILGVVVNILILFIYKYLSPILSVFSLHITMNLPVGLSFFIFSCISYLADVYTGKSKAQTNLLKLALYVCFFGKVTMGPIVQYHNMESQLEARKISFENIRSGSCLFIVGLFKKAVLADSFSVLFSSLYSNASVLGTWLCALAYMLQIYFDFSGYSDMAIGISRCFGFDFDPNFDHPYTAVSIQDFWRKWHISLSRWFRDYVYIPLGGSRVENKLYIRNILVVWLLTGIWHGANLTFIVWGIYFGLLLLLERFVLKEVLQKLPKVLQHLYALILVYISWIFFSSNTLLESFQRIIRLVGIGSTSISDGTALFYLKSYFVFLVLGILFSIPIKDGIENYILKRFKKNSIWILIVIYSICFIIALSCVVQSTFQSFLYFAF